MASGLVRAGGGRPSAPLVVLLVTAMSACGSYAAGDRAQLDGACPDGETCSAESGRGLRFERGGTIALGGTVTIDLDDARGYVVTNYEAEVEPPVLVVVERAVGAVTLRAVAEGSGMLRILDGQGNLRDRTTLQVARAPYIRAYYGWALNPASRSPEELEAQGVYPLESVAIAAGAMNLVWLDLGGGLWDDTAGVTIDGQGAESFQFPRSVGTFEVVVRGGGLLETYYLPIVEAPDPVEVDPDGTQLDPSGASSRVCFRGFAGGRLVAGFECSFAPDEGVEIDDVEAWGSQACVVVSLTPDGTRGVTATCGRTVHHWAHPAGTP